MGKEQGQDSCPELAKGIFHTTEHHAQCINRGELARRGQLQLGDWLGISQWVAWISFLLLPFLFITVIIVIILFLIYFNY